MTQFRHFIGLMSGTSVDAVDAALVAFHPDEKTQLIWSRKESERDGRGSYKNEKKFNRGEEKI